MNAVKEKTNFQKTQRSLPWATYIFLFIVFFVASQQNLFWTVGDPVTADRYAVEVEQGSVARPVSLFCLGAFGVFCLIRKNHKLIRINGLLGWSILFFLVWAFASVGWADDKALAIRRVTILAMLCLGALGFAKISSDADMIFLACICTTLFMIIGLSAELALGTFHPLDSGYRFAGTVQTYGQGVNCALLLLTAAFLARIKRRGRFFFHIIAVIALIFLILTKTRTAFFSAVVALIFYWGLVSSTKGKLMLSLSLTIIFCLILLFAGNGVFGTLGQGLLLGRPDDSMETSTLTGRLPLWNQALSYISEHPIVGYGYESFWTPQHIRTISRRQGWGRAVSAAHSAYLELLLSLGIIGAASFLIILVCGMKRSISLYRVTGDESVAFPCILLIWLSLDGFLGPQFLDISIPSFLAMAFLAKMGFVGDQAKFRTGELDR
jgi:O-antigen ligase